MSKISKEERYELLLESLNNHKDKEEKAKILNEEYIFEMLSELYNYNSSTYSYLSTIYHTKSIKSVAILYKNNLVELNDHSVILSEDGKNICKTLEEITKKSLKSLI
jgi:hypothetical protein